jgi:hypothetical protein
MKRWEKIDEEKRARRIDLRHCGMTSDSVEDIPFGIRAIQRGFEVEGIWISSLDSSDQSRVASSATLIGDQTEVVQVKTNTRHRGVTPNEMALEGLKNIDASTDVSLLNGPFKYWDPAKSTSRPSRYAVIERRDCARAPCTARTNELRVYAPTGTDGRSCCEDRNYVQASRIRVSAPFVKMCDTNTTLNYSSEHSMHHSAPEVPVDCIHMQQIRDEEKASNRASNQMGRAQQAGPSEI